MSIPATSGELVALLGDVDAQVIERIVETEASIDEVGAALAAVEAERQTGMRRDAPSAGVAAVRAILDDALLDQGDDGDLRGRTVTTVDIPH